MNITQPKANRPKDDWPWAFAFEAGLHSQPWPSPRTGCANGKNNQRRAQAEPSLGRPFIVLGERRGAGP